MTSAGREDFTGTARYAIQRRLGRGGFGVVYQAFDRQQNAIVALKTLHRPRADALFRFKREFRALAEISHPNLVTLYDLCPTDRTGSSPWNWSARMDFLTYVRPQPVGEGVETRTIPDTLATSEIVPVHGAAPCAVERLSCPVDPVHI